MKKLDVAAASDDQIVEAIDREAEIPKPRLIPRPGFAATLPRSKPSTRTINAESRRIAPIQDCGAYVRKALAGECSRIAALPEGSRAQELHRSACRIGRYVGVHLDRSEAEQALRDAARAAGLDDRDAHHHIRRGLDWGQGEPWDPASDPSDEDTRSAQIPAMKPLEPTITNTKKAGQPKLNEKALYGPFGDFVRALDPETESHPAAILFTTLVYFGTAAGRNCYFKVEATRHFPTLFATIVGASGRSRKGTSEGQVRAVFKVASAPFVESCMKSGLSSGEGLIDAIGDEVKGVGKDGESVVLVPGVDDKRLQCTEQELARVLASIARKDSTLSAVIRSAWDQITLSTLTRKKNALKATDPHIGILGHITNEELQRTLTSTEAANGFANRFLWVMASRTKSLPFGGAFAETEYFGEIFRKALEWSWHGGERELLFDEEAKELWVENYDRLSDGRPGLLGAVTARGDANTRRLALIYAIADQSDVVRRVHLEAALACWDYSLASAAVIFGDRSGDETADKLYELVKAAAKDGLTRTEIGKATAGHIPRPELDRAIEVLVQAGRIVVVTTKTGGRPETRWVVS